LVVGLLGRTKGDLEGCPGKRGRGLRGEVAQPEKAPIRCDQKRKVSGRAGRAWNILKGRRLVRGAINLVSLQHSQFRVFRIQRDHTPDGQKFKESSKEESNQKRVRKKRKPSKEGGRRQLSHLRKRGEKGRDPREKRPSWKRWLEKGKCTLNVNQICHVLGEKDSLVKKGNSAPRQKERGWIKLNIQRGGRVFPEA